MTHYIPVVIGGKGLRGGGKLGAMVDGDQALGTLRTELTKAIQVKDIEVTPEFLTKCVSQTLALVYSALKDVEVYHATLPTGAILVFGDQRILDRLSPASPN